MLRCDKGVLWWEKELELTIKGRSKFPIGFLELSRGLINSGSHIAENTVLTSNTSVLLSELHLFVFLGLSISMSAADIYTDSIEKRQGEVSDKR